MAFSLILPAGSPLLCLPPFFCGGRAGGSNAVLASSLHLLGGVPLRVATCPVPGVATGDSYCLLCPRHVGAHLRRALPLPSSPLDNAASYGHVWFPRSPYNGDWGFTFFACWIVCVVFATRVALLLLFRSAGRGRGKCSRTFLPFRPPPSRGHFPVLPKRFLLSLAGASFVLSPFGWALT